MKTLARIYISGAIATLAVFLYCFPIAWSQTMAHHDRQTYEAAVSAVAQQVALHPCTLSIDPTTGSPTVNGTIVAPTAHVVAPTSCSSTELATWTDRRLALASDGRCGTHWYKDNSRFSECAALRRTVSPVTTGLPMTGTSLAGAGGSAGVAVACHVESLAAGCREWSK